VRVGGVAVECAACGRVRTVAPQLLHELAAAGVSLACGACGGVVYRQRCDGGVSASDERADLAKAVPRRRAG